MAFILTPFLDDSELIPYFTINAQLKLQEENTTIASSVPDYVVECLGAQVW